jgi:hypothetical protein
LRKRQHTRIAGGRGLQSFARPRQTFLLIQSFCFFSLAHLTRSDVMPLTEGESYYFWPVAQCYGYKASELICAGTGLFHVRNEIHLTAERIGGP